MALDAAAIGRLCLVSLALESFGRRVGVEHRRDGRGAASASFSASGSPPARTTRRISSALRRASSGVSAPCLPIVARRSTPSGVR